MSQGFYKRIFTPHSIYLKKKKEEKWVDFLLKGPKKKFKNPKSCSEDIGKSKEF